MKSKRRVVTFDTFFCKTYSESDDTPQLIGDVTSSKYCAGKRTTKTVSLNRITSKEEKCSFVLP